MGKMQRSSVHRGRLGDYKEKNFRGEKGGKIEHSMKQSNKLTVSTVFPPDLFLWLGETSRVLTCHQQENTESCLLPQIGEHLLCFPSNNITSSSPWTAWRLETAALSSPGRERELQPVYIRIKTAGSVTTCQKETSWNQPWCHLQRAIPVMEDISVDVLPSDPNGLHIALCIHSSPTAKLLQVLCEKSASLY